MAMSGSAGAMTPRQEEMKPLFEPLALGAIETPHRVYMAPLTRNRANSDGMPKDMAIDYYKQRASAGVIFTEATQISPMGKGYLDTPGIYDEAQTAKWKEIVDAVHNEGGKIILQLWHVGRISHTSLLPGDAQPLAPSAIRAKTQTFTAQGFEDVSEPKAMTQAEIDATVKDYADAAERAIKAGFDGVEIHAANGYLIDQFLRDGSNKRNDSYGGSIENRIRFLKEVVTAVTDRVGADKTGVRIAPTGAFNDMSDSDPAALFSAVVETLNGFDLAFLHVVQEFPGEEADAEALALFADLKKRWKGAYIANGGYSAERAARDIAAGKADAVTFGRPFIANPDLPKRFAFGADVNEPDQSTFYGGGREGYTDYPFLEEKLAEAL